MELVNDHDPQPLLDRLAARYGEQVAVAYRQREPGAIVIDFVKAGREMLPAFAPEGSAPTAQAGARHRLAIGERPLQRLELRVVGRRAPGCRTGGTGGQQRTQQQRQPPRPGAPADRRPARAPPMREASSVRLLSPLPFCDALRSPCGYHGRESPVRSCAGSSMGRRTVATAHVDEVCAPSKNPRCGVDPGLQTPHLVSSLAAGHYI
jgi:hypothetical protein